MSLLQPETERERGKVKSSPPTKKKRILRRRWVENFKMETPAGKDEKSNCGGSIGGGGGGGGRRKKGVRGRGSHRWRKGGQPSPGCKEAPPSPGTDLIRG